VGEGVGVGVGVGGTGVGVGVGNGVGVGVGAGTGVGVGIRLKLAVTLRDWSIGTEQLPVPVQSPENPENTYPEDGCAVTETRSPWLCSVVSGG